MKMQALFFSVALLVSTNVWSQGSGLKSGDLTDLFSLSAKDFKSQFVSHPVALDIKTRWLDALLRDDQRQLKRLSRDLFDPSIRDSTRAAFDYFVFKNGLEQQVLAIARAQGQAESAVVMKTAIDRILQRLKTSDYALDFAEHCTLPGGREVAMTSTPGTFSHPRHDPICTSQTRLIETGTADQFDMDFLSLIAHEISRQEGFDDDEHRIASVFLESLRKLKQVSVRYGPGGPQQALDIQHILMTGFSQSNGVPALNITSAPQGCARPIGVQEVKPPPYYGPEKPTGRSWTLESGRGPVALSGLRFKPSLWTPVVSRYIRLNTLEVGCRIPIEVYNSRGVLITVLPTPTTTAATAGHSILIGITQAVNLRTQSY
jgi:hypothetical protein